MVPESPVGPTASVARTPTPSRVVPRWRDGLTDQALGEEYRRILAVLHPSRGLRVNELAAAVGVDMVPAKIEGVRATVKRLVERGWAAQPQRGVFTAPAR